MPSRFPLHGFIRSRPHLSLAIVLGLVVWPLLPSGWEAMTRLLTAWNVAVWAYLIAMSGVLIRSNHKDVKTLAARQDERASVVLVAMSVASMMSLAAIISQLSALKDMAPDQRLLHYGFTVLTLLGSWFLLGMLFCVHYAHLFYRSPDGKAPLQFPDKEADPDYWDFLYFSFTIAAALQTSDVAVLSRPLRKIVVGQTILAFFFNLVILGLSINLAAGLINP
jgi:uncharacterized membrane protein